MLGLQGGINDNGSAEIHLVRLRIWERSVRLVCFLQERCPIGFTLIIHVRRMIRGGRLTILAVK